MTPITIPKKIIENLSDTAHKDNIFKLIYFALNESTKSLNKSTKSLDINIINSLIENNAVDINKKMKNGTTLLTGFYFDCEIVKFLLSCKNINVNVPNRKGEPILSVLCRMIRNVETLDIIDLLIENPEIKLTNAIFNTNKYCNTEFERIWGDPIVATRIIDLFNKLMNHKTTDINKIDATSGYTILTAAIRSKNYNFVKKILANSNIDVNKLDSTGFNPLMVMVQNDLIPELLNHKDIDITLTNSITDDNLLMLVIKMPQYDEGVFKKILNHKDIDINYINKNNETALSLAIKRDDHEMVKLIMKHKDLHKNIKIDAIMIANILHKGDIVKLLLDPAKKYSILNLNGFPCYCEIE